MTDATTAWLVRAALDGLDATALLARFCERLEAEGIPLCRAFVASNLLDPVLGGIGVRWERGRAIVEERFEREGYAREDGDWRGSPFFHLVASGEAMMRRRFDATYRTGEIALLDRIRDAGATDYVAYLSLVSGDAQMGDFQGNGLSFATDRPGGFDDAMLARIGSLIDPLGLVFTLKVTARIARTLLSTYLGADAALRVLAGNVVRGQAEPIRAVVWFSDLAGFTRITETEGPQGALDFLNAYAAVVVEGIEAEGGTVLKFLGDGVLAIFRTAERSHEQALRAVDAVRAALPPMEAQRRAAGLPTGALHIALHEGELLYGNFGSVRRLDFTVLGPAVNQASRLEALSRSLDQPVVVSQAFAEGAGPLRDRLVSLGRYALKGVDRPQELFTLDPVT